MRMLLVVVLALAGTLSATSAGRADVVTDWNATAVTAASPHTRTADEHATELGRQIGSFVAANALAPLK